MGLVVSVSPFRPAPAWVRGVPFGEGDLDPESQLENFRPKSPYPHALPEDPLEAARLAGAPASQIRQAEELAARGLHTKAERHAVCGVYGSRCDCSDTDCRFRGFRRFRCKNRYCLACGRLAYNALFKKYLGLKPVADKLAGRRGVLIAKIDFTTVNLGRMPTGGEVRIFNACIKRFWRKLQRARGFSGADYGLLYCDEFGPVESSGDSGDGTNLHAHGVYVRPVLPHPWFGKGQKLSDMWKAACKGTVFEGSFIISLKDAGGFSRGLGHAFKYAGKFLSKDPARLADLELAFHGVRRAHTLGAFYNALPKDKPGQKECGPSCPECGSALNEGDSLLPICVLQREGRRDLDEARRAARLARVLNAPPGRED